MLFAKYLSYKKVIFFCITKSLISYIKTYIKKPTCLYVPDAHASLIAKKNQLNYYYSDWSVNYRPKVGYFGLLNNQKGKNIIKGLLRTCCYADFYIYTLNEFLGEYPNLVESRTLTYKESLEMMNKMDFLLLTIVPQNFYRDISSFTSPYPPIRHHLSLEHFFLMQLNLLRMKVCVQIDWPILLLSEPKKYLQHFHQSKLCHYLRPLFYSRRHHEV